MLAHLIRPTGSQADKIVCRIRRLRRIRPILRLRFPGIRGSSLYSAVAIHAAQNASNGRRSRKMPSAPARNQMLARGGFHQRWQGVGHHDFNHSKPIAARNVPRIRAFLRGRWAATARRSRRKADSWRRWKSPANQPPRRFQPLNAVQVQGAIIICCAEPATEVIDSVTISALTNQSVK